LGLKNKNIQVLIEKSDLHQVVKLIFLGLILILLCLKIRDLDVSKASLFAILHTLSGNLGYFFAAIALLFLNYFLEIKKWKLLTASIERRTFSEATEDVLRGLRGGIFTPFMIGDFLGRSLGFGKKNRTEAMAVNLFNSVCQTYTAIFLVRLLFSFGGWCLWRN